MILVSGAGGKTGRAVISALARYGADVRALTRRAEHSGSLRRLGTQAVVVGDMRDHAAWTEAMRGTSAVYHICPNVSPDEVAIGKLALGAARVAGVRHFVYHSVLHPQTEAMPHHWNKLRVEERIFESGLPFTILQPAAYMQNVLAGWESITSQGLFHVPYAVDTRLGMVDLDDVAGAAVTVLTAPGHEGAIYELAGPDVLTQVEVAAVLTRRLGREVQAETVSLDAWERRARVSGLTDYGVDTLRAMFHYYERFGFSGNPRALEWLLGRPPTSLDVFLSRIVQSQEE